MASKARLISRRGGGCLDMSSFVRFIPKRIVTATPIWLDKRMVAPQAPDPLSVVRHETSADDGPEAVEVRVGGAMPTGYEFVSPFGAVLLVLNRRFGATTEIALSPQAALKLAAALTAIANQTINIEH